jgi:predicted MFS family arabinose efflux permease
MTSLCVEYYQFVLAQGVLEGFCAGVIFTTTLSIPNHYFRRKIGTALGVIVGGSSIGGVIFPITLNKLLNSSQIGFGWSVRICGFIMTVLLCLTCMTLKSRIYRTRETPNSSSFKRPVYYLTVTAYFFIFWGVLGPFFYLPSLSMQRGMGTELASYLIAILNGSSLFGRILPGIVADRLGRYNMMLLVALGSGILLLFWEHLVSNASIIIFTALFGFFYGAIVTLATACIAQITPSPRQIGAHIGLSLFVASFACLSGPPISGALVAHYGSYVDVGYFGGASVLFGWAILLGARLIGEKSLLTPF